MGFSPHFKKKVLAVSVSSCMVAPFTAMAQSDMTEELLVTGIRASQASSIGLKRGAASVVDGIVAEDIGKLPDVTISDSLQRIPGIQVERTAGESGPVQIRGMANVDSMLNGETFLSATSIDTSDVDFGDLPSQLFGGADVFKSALATLPSLGITGTVDLKTRRPFDFEEGFTFSAAAEADYGTNSEEYDPTINGLASWRNDSMGLLLSAVTTEKNLSTDYNGYFDTSEDGGVGAARSSHTWSSPPEGLDPNEYYVVPQGFAAFNKSEERHRDGLNASFQADLGEGFELTADYFYSKQERWNRRAGISHNNRWQTFSNYAWPTEYGSNSFVAEVDGTEQQWRTVTAYEANPYRLQSFAQTNKNTEMSQNSNIELNYDNGGPLTGQVRATRAHATAHMRHGYGEGDVLSIDRTSLVTGPGGLVPAAQCDTSRGDIVVGENGACFAAYSPGGIEDADFLIGYDVRGEHPSFSGFDQVVSGAKGDRTVAEYLADIDSYHIGAFSSENNTDDVGSMNTFSTRWNYAFEDTPFITSVDAGLRQAGRSVERTTFSYFGELNGGCSAQWKAVDQFAGTDGCDPDLPQGELVTGVDQNGTAYDNEFVNYTLLPPTRLDEHTSVMWVDDFGDVSGLPGAWVIDPRNFDDTLAFQERVFGPQRKVIQPGESYTIDLGELSYWAQANFEAGPVTGNLGLKVVETTLNIRQNTIGDQIPHSGTNVDTGDAVTEREYTDYLPSLNLNYSILDDLNLRFAYGKTMQPLDLLQWGGGKRVARTFDDSCGCMRVTGGQLQGNPELDPTRASNFDLSLEYYLGEASMFSVATYLVEIDSFVQTGSIMIDEPDADGVSRGPWPFDALVQGTGGEVTGIELAAKMAFGDMMDVPVLSNMGMDLNYTLSDSSQDATGINGEELPFTNNSKNTYNIVGWFENDLLSARIAYNFRSERMVTPGTASPFLGYQSLYQDDYGQLDMNLTFTVMEDLDIYLNGSNILGEIQETYLEFEDQKVFQNQYETRWALGARYTF